MHDGSNAAAMLLEQIQHCVGIANVDVVMFVTANIRNQIVARFPGRGFDAEEFRPHIVVDPNHARAVSSEALYALRANQSRRTCDDDRAHDDPFNGSAVLLFDDPCHFACGRVHSRRGKLLVAFENALD